MRPGRLDCKIESPHSTEEERAQIMQIHSRKMNVYPYVNFEELACSTDDFNGAQLKAVCVEAGMLALRRDATEELHTSTLIIMSTITSECFMGIFEPVVYLSIDNEVKKIAYSSVLIGVKVVSAFGAIVPMMTKLKFVFYKSLKHQVAGEIYGGSL
ncbi:26S proteasome regulatory subunit 6A [Tanacetum coccineum]